MTDAVLALQRGNSTLLVVTQAGSGGGDVGVTVDGLEGWADGVVLTDVVRSNETYVVKGGAVQLTIRSGEPIILTAVSEWRSKLKRSSEESTVGAGVVVDTLPGDSKVEADVEVAAE